MYSADPAALFGEEMADRLVPLESLFFTVNHIGSNPDGSVETEFHSPESGDFYALEWQIRVEDEGHARVLSFALRFYVLSLLKPMGEIGMSQLKNLEFVIEGRNIFIKGLILDHTAAANLLLTQIFPGGQP